MILLNTNIILKDGRTLQLRCTTDTVESHSILNKRIYPNTENPALYSDELGTKLFETILDFLREKGLTP